MASTIAAGTTTGTAIAIAGDTTGNLAFQTNGTTTAMTIDTSQNVGIGTSSPGSTLDVTKANGGNFVANFQNTTAATSYGVWIKDPSGSANGYPLLTVGTSNGVTTYFRVDSGTGNVLINNGYGSAATAYGCRAWVNFNGTGTPAILASGNVSSITDHDTGQYTVNFGTAMPDANYACVLTTSDSPSGSTNMNIQSGIAAPTTSGIRIFNNWNGSAYDQAIVTVAIFR